MVHVGKKKKKKHHPVALLKLVTLSLGREFTKPVAVTTPSLRHHHKQLKKKIIIKNQMYKMFPFSTNVVCFPRFLEVHRNKEWKRV